MKPLTDDQLAKWQEARRIKEAEWLTSQDPPRMLSLKFSGRKKRLLGCAFARRVWGDLDDVGRRAIEVAERYADGGASDEELLLARELASAAARVHGPTSYDGRVRQAAAFTTTCPDRFDLGVLAYVAAVRDNGMLGAERAAQAKILREIVGNPFCPAPRLPAGGDVLVVARTIYSDRSFHELPVLADALEDAGCSDDPILSHLRGPGPHVRGCWALDMVLGKE